MEVRGGGEDCEARDDAVLNVREITYIISYEGTDRET